MELLFIGAEVAPYSGSSSLARFADALPKSLRGQGHSVTVLSPLFGSIEPSRLSLARRLSKITVERGGESYDCEVYDGRTAAGVELVFLGNARLFGSVDRFAPEGEPVEQLALRVGVFAQAACKAAALRDRRPDVLNGLGWVGAAVLQAAKANADLAEVPRLLTVHSDSSPRFAGELASLLGVAGEALESDGSIDLLHATSDAVDRFSTLGSATAAALRDPKRHPPLAAKLSSADSHLDTIPVGIDVARWNSLTDPLLPARFDPIDDRGKATCRSELQRALELPIRPEVALLVAFATPKESAELSALIVEALHNDVQLVVRAEDAAPFAEVAERFSDRLRLLAKPSEELDHRLFAAADLILRGADDPFGGSSHLIALRYGALPIAPREAELLDALVDIDSALQTGNAFLYSLAGEGEALAATRRAFAAFERRDAFRQLRRRAQRSDCSWERGARLYELIERELVEGDDD